LNKGDVSFKTDHLAVITKYFYLVYINIGYGFVPAELSIPSISRIIYREVQLFKYHFTPPVEDP
jgi:hypothetical protein